MTDPTPHTFAVGDLVRTKGGHTVYELDDINTASAGERKANDEYWATGWGDTGTGEWGDPSEVELVLTAAQAAARSIPSVAQLIEQVGSSLHGGLDEHVRVDETEGDGDDSVLAYGTTHDGLRISFRVTISDVGRVDL